MVTAAYWVWIVAAAALVFFGVMALFIAGDATRESMLDKNPDADVDAALTLIRGFGGITIVVGLVIAALVGQVRKGKARMRRALAVLSVVFAFMLVVTTTIGIAYFPLVIVAVAMLVATFLVYRPAAAPWFHRVQ
ncbi:hypothetical protein OG921_01010 [Aldersonia sp. NBC_00410]|uniref:hypothetical protein n=1 Tax=Aldersonia sp. NBC_00410 TaxID=2975954 RepID=UPI002252CF69|nr:hypothetical protein [Aldersonia sp. NBC_00410]MCX5041770.1 hypothetical protein [Aldersonia sp. NBC_00410]